MLAREYRLPASRWITSAYLMLSIVTVVNNILL